MMMINIDTYNEARARLSDPLTRPEGIAALKKILEIKEAHLWRSEAIAPCCGNLGGFACQLNEETQLLQEVIPVVEKGDLDGAKLKLDRLALLIGYGMGQKETPDLVERLTASQRPSPV